MDTQVIPSATADMMLEAFLDTAKETIERSGSRLQATREGIVAASMVLSAFTEIEDEEAQDLARKWACKNPDLEF